MTTKRRDPITDASSRSGSSSASSSMSSLPDPGQSPSRGRSRRKRRSTNGRRHNNNDHVEEPFWWTFAKVGGYLLIFCATCYILLLQRRLSSTAAQEESYFRHETLQGNNNHNNNQGGLPHRPKSNPPPLPVPSIGVYDQELARQDTFGIAYQYLLPQNYSIENASRKKANKKLSGFAKESALLLQQFTTLVGGEEEARAILQRSLLSLAPSSSQNKEGAPRNLATRLQHILHQKDGAFQVVILGSTAAAGSGVLHNQSYASVLQNNMEPIFESVGIRWNVTNLAIEDTAEFPTIWCLDHYLFSTFPDVIIWDYGYTSTADSLEAFLRNVVAAATQHNRPLPFLIFRDNKHPTYNDQRDSLLQTYVDHNVLMEPVLVHADRAAAPYFRMNREHLPVAFQGWRSHATLPGDARLTVPHHGMIGWLLSMHLLSALELVVASPQTGIILPASKQQQPHVVSLPPPFVIQTTTRQSWTYDHERGEEMILQSNPAWLSLLVGEPVEEKAAESSSADSKAKDGTSPYRFVAPGMQCMTSYITDRAPDTLDKLIVSGVSKSILDLEELNKDRHHLVEELLLPKGSLFSKGWVQDLDKGTKRKVHLSQQRKDEAPTSSSHAIKKAYFGMPRSGSLTFFIPVSKGQERAEAELLSKGFVSARGYIETVTLCEADQPEYTDTEDTCRLSRDANIVLGDEVASPEPLPADVSLYCATIHVPDHSNLAFKHDVVEKTTKQKKKTRKASPQEDSVSGKPEIGLSIELSVRSIRGTFREPCSIAHVLWNEVEEDD